MRLFGLTGGIGMGKSAAADLLGARNVPVVDTDAIARRLVEPGEPALEEILATFGRDLLGPDGRLRRGELGRRVFNDAGMRAQLEAILHPRIRQAWLARVAEWREEGRALGVVVIPLLFETGAAPSFDSVVCVACSEATQLRRLRERGWDADQIQQRIAAQWPLAKKMELANYVVWTEGSLAVHAEQWSRIIP